MILISVITVIVAIIIATIALFLNSPLGDISPIRGAAPNMERLTAAQKFQREPLRSEITKLIAARNMPTTVRTADIPTSPITYQSLKYLRRPTHVGQFKLQLSEIQFLTECLATLPHDKQIYVVYAGSGPGHSRQNLADMFPNMKFVLIDPQEHVIKGCAGCMGPRMHEPRSKLYFRKSRKSSAMIFAFRFIIILFI